MATSVPRLSVLRPSHHCCEDEERDQPHVDDGGKEHVTGRGCWCTSLSRVRKVVDAI